MSLLVRKLLVCAAIYIRITDNLKMLCLNFSDDDMSN